MSDAANQERALEILACPHASESEWLAALALLDGKLPAARKNHFKNYVLLCKRTTGLFLAYLALFMIYGAFQPLSASCTILAISLVAWAFLEASTGLFTVLCLFVLISNMGNILTLHPELQTTWMVILINLFFYSRYSFTPLCFSPAQKFIESRSAKSSRALPSKSN